MMNEESLKFGMHVVNLLCLIIIALSVHKLANPRSRYSYMEGEGEGEGEEGFDGEECVLKGDGSDNVRYCSLRDGFSGDGANEFPSFWYVGDIEGNTAYNYTQVNAELASAKFDVANRLNVKPYVGTETQRLEDEKTAKALGLMNINGTWLVDQKLPGGTVQAAAVGSSKFGEYMTDVELLRQSQ
jgi:hypothetical protein